MEIVVFEDEGWTLFSPLNLLRHTSLLRWGTRTLMESLSRSVGERGQAEAWGRAELAGVSKGMGISYNTEHESTVLLVNSRARPGRILSDLSARKTPFAATSKGGLVAARLNGSKIKPGVLSGEDVSKILKSTPKIQAPAGLLFQGYWDLVASNGLAIAEQAARYGDSLTLPASSRVKGPPTSLRVQGSAEVEDYVSFDTRPGPIIVSEGVSIESFSRLSGPCYIGPRTKITTGLIRGGTSIFEGCKVGGEVENSILMPHTNKAHLGYVGDSYVGEWVNVGAGSTFSNLKNTYGNVRSSAAGSRVDTGLLKLGPAVGDMAKVSIGALVFTGKTVGAGSQVTGLAAADVPPFTYFDGARGTMVELHLVSVLETQRRMKERRGMNLSRAEEELVRFAFAATASERRKAGAKKGRIT
jgi:UDP-N-acetylglucosamine diphosphorylase/glucosamine-1-phosphate N-acetyltransferase